MKSKIYLPLVILLMVTLACGLPSGGQSTDTPAGTTTEPAAAENTPADKEPTEVSEPEEDSLAVKSLEDAEKAVIRIVVQGAYEYAGYGTFESSASGSGFIIDSSGIAITNNHVVTGAALIQVYFSGDPKAYNASLLGYSECSDLAVIDIQGEGFPFLTWAEAAPKLGDEVYSLGYPLGDPEFTRHQGNISKRSADLSTNWTYVDSLLEHDAIINPGNSGGPLVNENGQVVGINYASAAEYDQYYAITQDEALPLINSMQDGVNVTSIGVNGEAFVTEDSSLSGIWVYSVESGSPADKAGVKAGDILTRMEGISLARNGTMEEYCGILRGKDEESTISLEVMRMSTGEILDGQVNGRELDVSQTFDPGGTTEGTEGTEGTEETTDVASEPFYTDEFEGDLTNWVYFLMNGDEDSFGLTQDRGVLTFDLQDTNIWAYLVNDAWSYTDVQVDVFADNRGQNTNNVSLLCRYSDEEGWYEFNIFNSGLYKILIYDARRNEYRTLADGGSQAIHQGKNTNQYTAVCSDDDLTLYINGQKVKSVSDRTLREGLIGVSVSSFEYIPVVVDFEWLIVSEP